MSASGLSSPSPLSAAAWKQRYEALRQLALAGRQVLETEPLGLILLLRQGVAGWMGSWSKLAQAPPSQRAPRSQDAVVPTSAWQHQLTEVLAEMSLAHLPNQAVI
jgi:hypothetical protein